VGTVNDTGGEIVSLIPAFRLGLWNAWIFVLAFLLLFIIWGILDRLRGQTGASRPDKPPFNETEKKLYGISQVALWASNAYSIVLPLSLGSAWFYAGLVIYLVGMIFTIVSGTTLDTTPEDKPATDGLYRISRNPIYLGCFLIYIGIGVASASWLFLLLTTIWIILYDKLIAPEEQWCLEKYGNAYRAYMDRTPKWIGIPRRND
jgi:protein-S-isoprenylcysteine O-methyltransferase Ste14